MKLETSEVPAIAIFAFKRPEILFRTLDRLRECNRVSEFDIYIHVDHPKSEIEVNEHIKVLKTIESFNNILNFKSIVVSEKHLGLKNSVITFLTDLASIHRYIVVLEDDIIVARDFLEYQLECLTNFEFTGYIGSISGTRFEKFRQFRSSDILLSKRHSSWGWGTWGSVLQSINWGILEDSEQLPAIKKEVRKVGKDLSNLIDLYLEGKIDSWSILFDINMIINKLYCIHPRYQKIQNIGFDSGTHFNSFSNKKQLDSPEIELAQNHVGVKIPKGLQYDLIVKIKRNCLILQIIVKLRNSMLPKKFKS